MYTFRPYTDRIWSYRERIRDRVIQTDAERSLLLTESYKKNKNVVPIIKYPMGTYDICANMTVRVEDDELFVGSNGKTFCGGSINPAWMGAGWPASTDIEGKWTFNEEDGLWHSPEEDELRLSISPEDLKIFREIADFWRDNRVGATADAWQPDGYADYVALEASDYQPRGIGLMSIACGHLTPGWEKIINVGYKAIRDEAQAFVDSHYGYQMGDDTSKYMFYKSAVIACDAATIMVRRYGEACAEKAAACTDNARKKELEMMADGLLWISEHPARTFWEACQAALMYQLFLKIDAEYPAPAFGRFDQYTWPFLKKDLEDGRLTMDEAQEMVDAFFLKSNCFYAGFPGKLAQTTGIGNTYQHTTIGGVDPETGEDATNPVTYMTLETIGRLKLHDPTISLRINKNSSDELWACALETAKLVGGLPLFQNDEVIIPGLMAELGFELNDARNYSVIGCQEIVGSGCDYPAPNGVHPPHASVHYGVIFDMAINNGINPWNGNKAPIHTGYLYEMTRIDEVREAFRKMSEYVLGWYVTINNYAEYLTSYHAPHAALSISMEGCMEKGMDCAAGGCKYNSYGGTATGLATIADCISTIKYMCFDKKLCTTKELYDAVMANWDGYEPLRQQILNEVPHYGNADPYVDDELTWVINMYYDLCQQYSNPRAKVYKSGLYGASDHVAQGYHTWATPDGRKTGEPIADAMSPAQSRDVNGPTAVFASSCCFDHQKFMDGIALNLRMHPTVLSRDDGIEKLRDMTKAYFESGGLEVQYNVVDTETLRAAQADPSSHRDLVVRIAGYSAYFVELNLDCQNDIIARNENRI